MRKSEVAVRVGNGVGCVGGVQPCEAWEGEGADCGAVGAVNKDTVSMARKERWVGVKAYLEGECMCWLDVTVWIAREGVECEVGEEMGGRRGEGGWWEWPKTLSMQVREVCVEWESVKVCGGAVWKGIGSGGRSGRGSSWEGVGGCRKEMSWSWWRERGEVEDTLWCSLGRTGWREIGEVQDC